MKKERSLFIAASKSGFFVGMFDQEDEVSVYVAQLTDDFSSREEAQEWIDSIMEEVAERKER